MLVHSICIPIGCQWEQLNVVRTMSINKCTYTLIACTAHTKLNSTKARCLRDQFSWIGQKLKVCRRQRRNHTLVSRTQISLNRFSASNTLCMQNYKFKFNCIAFRINLCNKCIYGNNRIARVYFNRGVCVCARSFRCLSLTLDFISYGTKTSV